VIGFWGFWGFPLLAPPIADLGTFEGIVIIYCRSGRMPTALAAFVFGDPRTDDDGIEAQVLVERVCFRRV